MFQNNDIDITGLLQLTNRGLIVADFVQIKNAIIKRYKEAYGDNIDLSTATADGVFINDLALLMNNILKTVETLYANLNVNYASGYALDMLCALSNIKRKQSSKSFANLQITNLSNDTIVLPAKMEFFDKAGTQWTATNAEDITLGPNGSTTDNVSLTVICETDGQVEAPANYITSAIDATLNIAIEQRQPAIVGENEESDADLRERRAQSNGAVGLTVLESLLGSLLEISAIKDVKIYNNYSSFETDNENNPLRPNGIPKDGTNIDPHAIYVLIRLAEGQIVSNEQIGKIIYEKLTPGIDTTKPADENQLRVYNYLPLITGINLDVFERPVYWKQCSPIHPNLKIKITINQYFNNTTKDSTISIIANALYQYLNNLHIGITPSIFDLQYEVLSADPKFKGNRTYDVTSITCSDAPTSQYDISSLNNTDTYYNYTSYNITEIKSDNSNNIVGYEITLY